MEYMEPFASQIRPQSLNDCVGQKHVIGRGKPLAIAIQKRHIFSFILWGPPGCGKTTLARIYAKNLDAQLYELSAVSAGKDDIKHIVTEGSFGKPKVLFLDEIHRLNKVQQDFLLPYVERGIITLVGATTENPSFEIIPALLSRCRVFILKALTHAEIREIITKAYPDISLDAQEWIARVANGDARQALTIVDTAYRLYKRINIKTLTDSLQSIYIQYDKKGEEHYNTISAFIKSMRAGQTNAAIYYLARMLVAGEDPKFIARRMVIFASEDIGLAQPTALVVANEVFRAVEEIGMPECEINLAHGAAYLCACKKDRTAYNALRAAQADVKTFGNVSIPLSIRNASTKFAKDLRYGEGYEMYDTESYLPDKLKGKNYFKKTFKENKGYTTS